MTHGEIHPKLPSTPRSSRPTPRRRLTARSGAITAIAAAGLTIGMVALAAPASAAGYENSVGLGAAGAYSVLAGSTVTNTNSPTLLSGDLGVSPGSAITGFPPGVAGGATNAGNASAASAQSSLTAAYLVAKGRPPTGTSLGLALVGGIHQPGVYNASSSLDVSGAVTLDGQGDPNSVFIFQVGASMTTASSTSIVLIGNAQACNVFWQIGASATLGTSTTFIGTVMALTSISLNTGTTVAGRALARNGAVTLDDNVFTSPSCHSTPTTTSLTATQATSGGSTTVTATVHATGASAPTGTVTFTANGVTVGTATIGANGRATLTLPVGTAPNVRLVAHYNGLGSYSPSTSPTSNLAVTLAVAQAAPAPTTAAAVPAVTTPSSAALANTGPTHVTGLIAGATALLLGGAGLTWIGRQRRRTTQHS